MSIYKLVERVMQKLQEKNDYLFAIILSSLK